MIFLYFILGCFLFGCFLLAVSVVFAGFFGLLVLACMFTLKAIDAVLRALARWLTEGLSEAGRGLAEAGADLLRLLRDGLVFLFALPVRGALLLWSLIAEWRAGADEEDAWMPPPGGAQAGGRQERSAGAGPQTGTAQGDPLLSQARALLGLGERFTSADLAAAFRAAMKRAHPDFGGNAETARWVLWARDYIRRANGW